MKRMRLKRDHPTAQKLQKIFRIMDNMGLYISVSDNEISLTDKQSDMVYSIEDMDSGGVSCVEFPPSYNYKVTYMVEEDDD